MRVESQRLKSTEDQHRFGGGLNRGVVGGGGGWGGEAWGVEVINVQRLSVFKDKQLGLVGRLGSAKEEIKFSFVFFKLFSSNFVVGKATSTILGL